MTSKLANPMANNAIRILPLTHVLSLISSGVLTDIFYWKILRSTFGYPNEKSRF